MTRRMVERIREHQDDDILGDFATLATPCPKCGGVVKESYRRFQCQRCDFALWKIVAGRQFEVAEMETLLREHRLGPLTGFRSKTGRPFAASVRLNDAFELEFDFGRDDDEQEGAAPVDFTGRESLGACPKCGARVFEHGSAYVCERSVGANRTCDFRTGRLILQQAIEADQVRKLLATGRTDLLRGFVSARTRRRFSARLVRGADGKVGFEFEPRAPRQAAGAKTAARTPASAGSAKASPASAKPAARRKKSA